MKEDALFAQQSLIDNLFYLRTIRMFALNIQLSFFENNQDLIDIASDFGKRCEEFGKVAIDLADGKLDMQLKDVQIFLTPYTLDAELLTEKLFGIDINTDLTETELNLNYGNTNNVDQQYIEKLKELNNNTYLLVNNFYDFCNHILERINNNELFSYSYPLFYQYMILETDLLIKELDRLINKTGTDPILVVRYQYYYLEAIRWITKFIAGLSDPSQSDIINQARMFDQELSQLLNKYNNVVITPDIEIKLNNEALDISSRIQSFLSSIIVKVLNGDAYFIVEPIFLDNLLTDINYFIYLLNGAKAGIPNT